MKELLLTGETADLEYFESCQALAGRIDGLSVAVRENEKTKSYGALFWVRAQDDPSSGKLSAFLENEVATRPHIVRHYKVIGRGAAVALVKYNDPARNINNIKRFMSELSGRLGDLSYENCCYKCGSVSGLGIYNDNNVPVQYCRNCAKGEKLVIFDGGEPETDVPAAETVRPVVDLKKAEPAAETVRPVIDLKKEEPAAETVRPVIDLKKAEPAAEPDKSAPTAETQEKNAAGSAVNSLLADESFGDLLADATAGKDEKYDTSGDRIISTASDKTDISGFMLTEMPEGEKKPTPVSAIFEAAQKEFDEQKEKERLEERQPDNSIDSLMFVGDGEEKLTASWGGEAPEKQEHEKSETDISDIGMLMFDENEADEGQAEEKKPEEIAPDTDIGHLMFDREQGEETSETVPEIPDDDTQKTKSEEIDASMYAEGNARRAADVVHLEAGEKLVTEVTAFTSGAGEALRVEERKSEDDEETDPSLEGLEVTEYHDDSNDGEDIDITALESKINEPTVNSGEQLRAEPAKLDSDGNVPLINPSLKSAHPTSSYAPDSVRAYAVGTYENATASDEPVGFDGRRKGDVIRGDPRGSDDDFEHKRKTGITSVSGGAKPSKPGKYKTGAASFSGSKPIVGTIAALLFGIIGAALWVGSGYLFDALGLFDDNTNNIIVAACVFLVTLLAFVGYRVGGDCYDIKGIVISSVISVILDAAGAVALFITAEFRWSSANPDMAYAVPFEKAVERMMQGIAGDSQGPLIYGKIFIIAGVAAVALAMAILIAKKKS